MTKPNCHVLVRLFQFVSWYVLVRLFQFVLGTSFPNFSWHVLVRLLHRLGQGPGPLGQGPGPLGPGPKLQDTHGECNYLLSGRLPTVRQTTYCQASYLLSGRLSAVMKLAPNSRIHAPKRLIDMHPKSAYMHPNVSAYMHLIPHTY